MVCFDLLWPKCLKAMGDSSANLSQPDVVHHVVGAALALEKTEDAIHSLLTAELFLDALLLSRLRLPARHPIIGHFCSVLGVLGGAIWPFCGSVGSVFLDAATRA